MHHGNIINFDGAPVSEIDNEDCQTGEIGVIPGGLKTVVAEFRQGRNAIKPDQFGVFRVPYQKWNHLIQHSHDGETDHPQYP